MIRKTVIGVALLGAMLSAGAAQAQPAYRGLSLIKGEWVEDRTGETVLIRENAFGFTANLSWIGEASISDSGGVAGSQIKVESADRRSGPGIVCFYRISINNLQTGFRRMVWRLAQPSTDGCPQSGVYTGAL